MNKVLVYITLLLNIHMFTDFHFHHHDHHDLEMMGEGIFSECINIADDEDHDHEELNCVICSIRKNAQIYSPNQIYYFPINFFEKRIYTSTPQSLFSQDYLSITLARAPPMA